MMVTLVVFSLLAIAAAQSLSQVGALYLRSRVMAEQSSLRAQLDRRLERDARTVALSSETLAVIDAAQIAGPGAWEIREYRSARGGRMVALLGDGSGTPVAFAVPMVNAPRRCRFDPVGRRCLETGSR